MLASKKFLTLGFLWRLKVVKQANGRNGQESHKLNAKGQSDYKRDQNKPFDDHWGDPGYQSI